MAHYFSTGSFFQNSSWHGKEIDHGGVFTERDTIYNHMIRCNMDYEVETVPSYFPHNNDWVEIPNKFELIVPATDWHPQPEAIRQVSNRYGVLQNERIAEIFEPLNSGNYPLESLGVLKDGRIVFLELRLEGFDVGGHPKENHRSYLAFANNHTANSIFFGLTTVRIECWNTIVLALRDMAAIPHSADAELELEFRTVVMQKVIEARQSHKDILDRMFVTKVDSNGIKAVVESTFPDPKKPRAVRVYGSVDALGLDHNHKAISNMANKADQGMELWGKAMERQREMRTDIVDAFFKFNDEQPYCANSTYALWNATTEILNHSSKFYGETDKNMVSLFFGQKNTMLSNAWQTCVDLIK